MYCPECGHQNPAGNKFCGMCGEHLPDRVPNPAPEKRKTTSEMRAEDVVRAAAVEHRERVAEHDPEPVAPRLRHREPVDAVVIPESEMPAAVTELYASRPAQEQTTVSGPSFLGLSDNGGGSSSYSYLYEDEQPASHASTIVFLLVLAILAGVVYWKWEPLRDYVVNAAMNHSGQGRPAPAPAATAPGSPTASSDNTAAQPGATANPNGLPQQDNAATPADQPKAETTQPKVDTTQPKDKDEATPEKKDTDKTSVPKDERPRSEVGRNSSFQDVKGKNAAESAAEDVEKPTAARRPATTAGTELVNNGEKYLYGRGVARSCSQALVNFNAAAKQDNPRAMSHLGSLYATGQCVALDRAQAYQWFSRALSVDRSNTYIEHNLNMLWRDMSSDERAKATQKRMF